MRFSTHVEALSGQLSIWPGPMSEHLGVVVVPFLIRKIDFDVEERDVFEMPGRNERRGVRVDIDALASGDLDPGLPGQVGVVVRLARGATRSGCLPDGILAPRSRAPCDEFLEHAIDQFAIAAIDRADFAQIEPEVRRGRSHAMTSLH